MLDLVLYRERELDDRERGVEKNRDRGMLVRRSCTNLEDSISLGIDRIRLNRKLEYSPPCYYHSDD